MPLSKTLRGDLSLAGRYLPFARNKLASLKRVLSSPFSRVIKLNGGAVKIRLMSDGFRDHILIRAESGRIIIYSLESGDGGVRGFINTPYYPLAVLEDMVDISPAPEAIFGPGFLGDHEIVYFLMYGDVFDASFPCLVLRSRENYGITSELVLTFNAHLSPRPPERERRLTDSTGFEFVYAGLVRDSEGNVTGKRLVIKTGLPNSITDTTAILQISDDTGDSWTQVTIPNLFASEGVDFTVFSGLSFVGNNTLLLNAAVSGGTQVFPSIRILRSTDGGYTWVHIPVSGSLRPGLNNEVNFHGRFIPVGDNKVILTPIRLTGGVDAGLLSTDNGLTWLSNTAAFPDDSSEPTYVGIVCTKAANPDSDPPFDGQLVLTQRNVLPSMTPSSPRYHVSSGPTFSWTEFPAPVPDSGPQPYLRVSEVNQYIPGVAMVEANDTSVPVESGGPARFVFVTKGDFSGWSRGGRVADALSPTENLFVTDMPTNVGSRGFAQPVNIALPHLYDNPV